MVVTARPATAAAGRTHERIGWPSTSTVQAPHRGMPQPYLVPVKPSTSRSTQSSGMSSGTKTSCSVPLTSSFMVAPPGPSELAVRVLPLFPWRNGFECVFRLMSWRQACCWRKLVSEHWPAALGRLAGGLVFDHVPVLDEDS